jgi:hypothetical protein
MAKKKVQKKGAEDASTLRTLLNKKRWHCLSSLVAYAERTYPGKVKVHAFNGMSCIINTWMIGLNSQQEKGEQLTFEATRKRKL